jgi:putative FmdB family regulatory protein
MPLYEYECGACGHRFEKIQKFSDTLESVCPRCGGVVRKLMSSPAIQFKGSGFYITDYVKKDQGGESKSDGKAPEASKSEGAGGAGQAGGAAKAPAAESDKPVAAAKAPKPEKPAS